MGWFRRKGAQPSFTCPNCGAVSHNRNDVEHQYCGACHQFADVYVSEFRVPTEVYGKQVSTSAGAVYWVSEDEDGLLRMGGSMSEADKERELNAWFQDLRKRGAK